MPAILFGGASPSGRADYGLPELRTVNMIVEEGGPAYQSPRFPRPGLVSAYAWASNPVRAAFQNDGVLSGAVCAVIGTAFYVAGVNVGTISGSDMVRVASSSTQTILVGSNVAYSYDGTTFAAVSDPDLPAMVDVLFFGGRHVYLTQNSGRFYFSGVSDAAVVDGLSFSNAESDPDYLVGGVVIGDEMALFGSQSTEWFDLTGDDDGPFQRSGAKRYQRGCKSRDSIVKLDNTVVWVGDDNIVYRAAGTPQRLSTNGIEAKIRQATGTLTAFAATWEGHAVYVLNVPGQGSWGYDASAPRGLEWQEWQSYGKTTFRGRCSFLMGGVTYIGDDASGAIWALTPGTYLDGTDQISFIVSAWLTVESGRPRCNDVVLQGARGVGLTTGQGSDPITELRYSDDQGKTFCNWLPGSLGAIGVYGKPPRWRRLALMKAPGRLFEVRTTDPVLASAGHLLVNEGAWVV